MKARIFYFTVLGAIFTQCQCGCRHIISEPLPDFTYATSSSDKLPVPVKAAFFRFSPSGVVEGVKTAWFKGEVVQYQLSFHTETSSTANVVFTPNGVEVAPPGAFRLQASDH